MIVHDSDGLTVHNADLLDALPTLAPGSIDSVVTSPPYAMQRKSTYGGVPEADYPEWTVEWMRALKPALSERGSVMLNISPHVKGGMLADYVLRMRLALRADGWYEHDELVWVKPGKGPFGAMDKPNRAWESVLWYSRSPRPWCDPRRNGAPIPHSRILRAEREGRFATGRTGRNGWSHVGEGSGSLLHERGRCLNFVSIGTGSLTGDSRGWDHPAPFPIALAEWLMNINTPDRGTVLDPFAGSGTTAVAALRNGFQSVAIEREPEYARMIVDRYQHEAQSTMPAITGLTC